MMILYSLSYSRSASVSAGIRPLNLRHFMYSGSFELTSSLGSVESISFFVGDFDIWLA